MTWPIILVSEPHKDRDFYLFLFTDAPPVTRPEPATKQLNYCLMFKRMISMCFYIECLQVGGYCFHFIDEKKNESSTKLSNLLKSRPRSRTRN